MDVGKISITEETLDITEATLLSPDEIEALPERLRKYHCWWWIRSPDTTRDNAAYISNGGSIVYFGNDMKNVLGSVRPALIISNLDVSNFIVGDEFLFGGRRFRIISDSIAFCLGDIGFSAFQEDWEDNDTVDYEASAVKKYVNNWFENAKSSISN